MKRTNGCIICYIEASLVNSFYFNINKLQQIAYTVMVHAIFYSINDYYLEKTEENCHFCSSK